MTTYLFTNIEMKTYFLADINGDPKTTYMQQETSQTFILFKVLLGVKQPKVAVFVEVQFYIAFNAITRACHAVSFTSTSAFAPF